MFTVCSCARVHPLRSHGHNVCLLSYFFYCLPFYYFTVCGQIIINFVAMDAPEYAPGVYFINFFFITIYCIQFNETFTRMNEVRETQQVEKNSYSFYNSNQYNLLLLVLKHGFWFFFCSCCTTNERYCSKYQRMFEQKSQSFQWKCQC